MLHLPGQCADGVDAYGPMRPGNLDGNTLVWSPTRLPYQGVVTGLAGARYGFISHRGEQLQAQRLEGVGEVFASLQDAKIVRVRLEPGKLGL
jgi:hypothetical protein